MLALDVTGISKTYQGNHKALNDVSFRVKQGEIFGLLGPNGAGKTTLVKSVLTIIGIDQGTITLFGHPHSNTDVRKRIGYLPENHRYPNFLTGEQVLFHYGKLAGVTSETLRSRIPELLKRVSMEKWGTVKLRKYSKGMMQRIGLAQALINDPDLIFLDEPTDGIDPVGRREIHDILKSLAAQNKTIFMNSHMLAEVESVCDTVAILKQGQLVRYGTVEEITTQKEKFVLQLESIGTSLEDLLKPYVYTQENAHTFIFELESYLELNRLIDLLRQHDILIRSMHHLKSTLEDSFIDIVK